MDLAREKEFKACLALRHCPGLGPAAWNRLLAEYGAALPALREPRDWSRRGLLRPEQVEAYLARSWLEEAKAEFATARRLGWRVLLHADPEFPEALRQIPDAPLFLYAQGRVELAAGPCLAVVGTRKAAARSRDAARRLAEELSSAGITVASGLALGVDSAAHEGGLAGPGSSLAVAGCGLDVAYPQSNLDLRARLEEQGLVLSEFAPGAHPDPSHFPQRNRILSGLCLGVVVVEAPAESGALITARLALEQGREVYVLEGPADSPGFAGSRELLEQGAARVAAAGEIILDLAPLLSASLRPARAASPRSSPARRSRSRPAPPPAPEAVRTPAPQPGNAEERAVLALLGPEPIHIDQLTRALGWAPGAASRVLLGLELKGLARQAPGMRYLAR